MGCVDHVFVIKQLTERCKKEKKKEIAACADYGEIVSGVCKEELWKVLEEYEVKTM